MKIYSNIFKFDISHSKNDAAAKIEALSRIFELAKMEGIKFKDRERVPLECRPHFSKLFNEYTSLFSTNHVVSEVVKVIVASS